MKASTIRKLATAHDVDALEEAASALINEEALPFEVDGEDDGERLTHVNLALRVRRMIDAGTDPKEAFRDVLGQVRDLLQND